MKATVDQKRRMYDLLKNSTIMAHLTFNGRSLNDSVKCKSYYNRNLGEITEENESSFKKIRLKFTMTDEDLEAARSNHSTYTGITFIGENDGLIMGALYKYHNDNDAEEDIPAESSEFDIEIEIDE